MCRPAAGAAAELCADLADGSLPFGEHVVGVDRLEVDLAREDEVAVGQVGHRLERALDREPDGVLDEAGLQVRVLDDEELVRPLQQLVDRRAHRALHDGDEVVRVELQFGADVERAAAALVVRRERHEVEDPLDVLVAGLGQPLGGAAADEALRTRASVDPGRLDSDDPAHTVGRGRRDPDERDHLLRREPADRRRPAHGPLGRDPRLGTQRALPADDVACDVLRERFDVQRLGPDHSLDRLLEQLGEAGHVDALLLVREVDGALDLGRHHRLVALVPDPDRLLDARDAGARQRQPHLGRGRLEIGRCA